ncbi:MAG: UDP-glucose 4-epimerase GalE [bacterium]|nr:UDP-glucose 4-epimerase GalE [bacterium]
MEKENILVTGGAGYIGSHVVRDLGDSGFNPVVYDNLSTGNKENVLCGDFVYGDLTDTALLEDTIGKYNIKSVIHFAASIVVEESVSLPLKYYQNNSINAFKLIQSCVNTGVRNFVFSSTAAVYGMPEKLPVDETAVMNPINPYGKSKVFTEMVLKDVSHAHPDFNYIALRYFNVAGADGKCRIGQKYKKFTHLMTLALKAAHGEFPQLKVFGTDYETRDGTAVRDYIHVDDLASAHLLAMDYLKKEKRSRIFNCGYGDGSTVLEVIKAAKEVTGIDFPVVNSERRAGDPPVLVADSSLIRKELGWVPKYNDLNYIIKTAWDWENKLKNG